MKFVLMIAASMVAPSKICSVSISRNKVGAGEF